MRPKISIIIPVYNTERYVRECLESVVNQTLRDIEIIVVNDASPDNSQSIIDEYARQDERIISIVHRKNQGLGGARNTGVSRASGEYIMFLDSDDTFMLNACEKLCNKMIKTGADLIAFNYYEIDEQSRVINKQIFRKGGEAHLRGEQILKAYIGGVGVTAYFSPSACNKIYKASIWHVHSIKYPQHVYMEDLYIAPEILEVCEHVAIIPNALLNYRQHTASIMGSVLTEKYLTDLMDALAHNKQYIHERHPHHSESIESYICFMLKSTFEYKLLARAWSENYKQYITLFEYWHECAEKTGLSKELKKALAATSEISCVSKTPIRLGNSALQERLGLLCAILNTRMHKHKKNHAVADIKLRQRKKIILALFGCVCVLGFLLAWEMCVL